MKRKSLKHRSKRAWIVAGVAAFAGVSLLSTGFAAWVVGVNSLTDSDNIGVEVDTVTNSSVTFTAEVDADNNSITLAEADSTGTILSVKDGATPDFTIGLDFTIVYGNEAGTPSTVTFTLPVLETNSNSANVVTTSNFTGRGTAGSWTYLAAPASVDITSLTPSSGPVQSGVYTTVSYSTTVTFTWGTFFNGVAPTAYYNSFFDREDDPLTPSTDYVNQIYSDLNTMYEALNSKTLSLTATLEMSTATTEG